MRRILSLSVLLLALVVVSTAQYTYPKPIKGDDTIKKFGLNVADPYRWLEDLDSKETKGWLLAQGELISKYRNTIYTDYTSVQRSIYMTLISDRQSSYIKPKIGDYFFGEEYDYATDNSPTILFKRKLSHEWGKLLSTAQFLHSENDAIAVQWYDVSPDDSLTTIGLSHGGSDWTEIVVVNMYSLKLLKERVEYTKFGCAWGKEGFFYRQYEKPKGTNEISARVNTSGIYYHQINTPVENDITVVSADSLDKDFNVIDKGKFLIVRQTKNQNGKQYAVYSYVPTDSMGKKEPQPFIFIPDQPGLDMAVIGEHNGSFIVRSNFKAPNGRIMLYDYGGLNRGKQLIEMFNQNLITSSSERDKIFCTYMDKGSYMVLVFDTTGKFLKKIDLPEGMSVSGFNRLYHDSVVYYYINSFGSPPVTMRFNLNTLKSELPYNDMPFSLSSRHITKVVSYPSRDSTTIYMYLTYDKDRKPDVKSPVLIYAYGGFGIANKPEYNPLWKVLLDKGVIIAVPLIRGGGEFGYEWHEAGRKLNKQNSVDDVAYAAKWLTKTQYTTADKIVLEGGSQGGWLMADVMVQYPELFRAVVPNAGIYDMLRYHLYSNLSGVGYPEFGNPDDSLDFRNLYTLSPYHQIKKGVSYPACLAIVGDKDDRVVPFHSYKLIAQLQENGNNQNPYLLYLEENSGHNNSASLEGFSKIALTYTFIMKMMKIDALR